MFYLLFILFLLNSAPLFCLAQGDETSESKVEITDFAPIEIESEGNAYFEGDFVNYDQETGFFSIIGNAILHLKKENLEIEAAQIDYYPQTEILKAYDNVVIKGKEQVTFADNFELNLIRAQSSHLSSNG